MTTEEWKRRFKAHIVARLTEPGSAWTLDEASEAAEAEMEGADFNDIYCGFENRPEASADESLSYWGDA